MGKQVRNESGYMCMRKCFIPGQTPSIHSYIHPFIHPYIHPFIHPYIHTSIHPSTMVYLVSAGSLWPVNCLLRSCCMHSTKSHRTSNSSIPKSICSTLIFHLFSVVVVWKYKPPLTPNPLA